MKKYRCLLILSICCGFIGISTGSAESSDAVQFNILSKRSPTEKELANFRDVVGVNLVVRMRIVNASDHYVSYLAVAGTVIPTGYSLYRKVGASEWDSSNPARGKVGPPGTELKADTIAHSWIELQPHAAIEYEAHDFISADQEHAFSILVRDGKREYEKFSDTYLPTVISPR
jgi:hypothetical protein